jgi:hypothetical protein
MKTLPLAHVYDYYHIAEFNTAEYTISDNGNLQIVSYYVLTDAVTPERYAFHFETIDDLLHNADVIGVYSTVKQAERAAYGLMLGKMLAEALQIRNSKNA